MSETIGASFKIDINNLKAGLTTANKLIRESQSQFKAAAAGLDSFSDAQRISEQKIKSLNEIIPIQEKKVKALKDQYKKLVDDGLDETSDRAIYLRTQINKETEALEKNKSELKSLEKSSDDAGDALEDVGDQADKTSGAFTVMKGALANLVADGFRMAIQAAKDFAKELVNVGMTFDDSMAQVAAVSGATGDELEMLRAKAKEMGSATKFTASEAADAFNYMAMAGWKTEDMLGGIEGILNLAAASGSDLATTSDIVTDALTAMGYSASDAGRLADVMAAASSNANTNVEMMGQTFQYAAPIVGALGYSMEDTAVAIGLMANAGIKGEKSGTALRSILTRLSAPPKECADAMSALGISITKTDGTMKSLDEIMVDMRKSFANLSETQQTANAKAIAGQEAMSGLLAIVNAAPEDFDKLTKAVEDSNGAATDMANTMLDTLGGDMTVLQSQLEGVRLEIYEELEPTLRGFVKEAQKAIKKINWKKVGTEAKNILKKLSDTAKSFAKNVLPPLKKALEVVGKALKFVIDNFGVLSKTVLVAVAAFKAFKAVTAITAAITAVKTAIAGLSAGVSIATKVQYGWNAAMSANPIGAVLTAVGLLTAAIVYLVTAEKDATEATDVLSESQRATVDAAKEAAESFRENRDAATEMAEATIANVDYVRDSLIPQLENLVDSNGEVQESDKARADFILNQLNEALGTEYSSLQDIIDQNGKVKQSVYDVIEAKKAQILLESYEESYRDALAQTSEAEKRRATEAQGLAKAEADLADAKDSLIELQDKVNKLTEEGKYISAAYYDSDLDSASYNVYKKQQLYDEQKLAYESATKDAQMYYDAISTYEGASTAILEGNTEQAIDLLSQYGNGFQTAASTMRMGADEQKKVLEQQVIDTEVNLQLMKDDYEKYSGEMTDEEKKQAEARLQNAKEQADKAKAEFYKVGGNITQGMAQGVEGSEWVLNNAMSDAIQNAVSAAKKAAGIKSPSKLFRKVVGLMIGKGIALGIDDSTQGVVSAVRNQVKDIENAYDFNGYSRSVDAGLAANNGFSGVNNSRTVTVNQYNTYSQAHSRYEIYKSKQMTAAAVRLALGTV